VCLHLQDVAVAACQPVQGVVLQGRGEVRQKAAGCAGRVIRVTPVVPLGMQQIT
jgi:hypothetical protein